MDWNQTLTFSDNRLTEWIETSESNNHVIADHDATFTTNEYSITKLPTWLIEPHIHVKWFTFLANAVSMYFEDNVTKTWDDALSDCMDRGMELAILNSQIEYDNASALITSRLVTTKI